MIQKRQRRVLFFVHDGIGLGHLRRTARLARALQGPCACLIVTGHRAASWIVPAEAEFVHLPSLDSLLAKKARYWGREPFLKVDRDQAVTLRKTIINATVAAFEPDAVVVDHLPLGKDEELSDVIEGSAARKYLVLRGVLGPARDGLPDVLSARGELVLERNYARILVASDRRVFDVAAEYGLRPVLSGKMEYVGYISEPVEAETIRRVREERGVEEGARWVVCSAGGGSLGERLSEECVRIADAHPDTYFDVILGPRTSSAWPAHASEVMVKGRVRVSRESRYLGLLHASADVVVCSGGYNSLVESLEGGARVLCVPLQRRTDDEQHIHPHRLSRFAPVRIVAGLDELDEQLCAALAHAPRRHPIRTSLSFDGAIHARDLIFRDLGLL